MANFYWASTINGGGTGAMDGIDPTDTDGSATALAVGDVCIVVDKANDLWAKYEVKSTASMSESFPTVIIPDSNPGNFWWDLVDIKYGYESPMNSAIGYANFPGVY